MISEAENNEKMNEKIDEETMRCTRPGSGRMRRCGEKVGTTSLTTSITHNTKGR